jgi:hypothetical protein
MKIAKITLESRNTIYQGYKRFTLIVEDGYKKHTVEKQIAESDLVSLYDIMMDMLVDEMHRTLIKESLK